MTGLRLRHGADVRRQCGGRSFAAAEAPKTGRTRRDGGLLLGRVFSFPSSWSDGINGYQIASIATSGSGAFKVDAPDTRAGHVHGIDGVDRHVDGVGRVEGGPSQLSLTSCLPWANRQFE